MHYLIMGVAGAGKSSVGKAFADVLSIPFIEGDDYHSPTNIEKMASGIPLESSDRLPWLRKLNSVLLSYSSAVIACSALTKEYRNILLQGCENSGIIFLQIDEQKCCSRLNSREGHFFPRELCQSQFKTLEAPGADEQAITMDALLPVSKIVKLLLEEL